MTLREVRTAFEGCIHEAGHAAWVVTNYAEVNTELGGSVPDVPREGMLLDSFVDPAEGGEWKLWTDRQADFDIPKDAPYHTVMVPTSATVHNQFLIRVVIEQGFNTCPAAPRVRRRSPPSRACCGRASTRTSTARWLRLLGPDNGEPVPGHH